MSGERDDLTAAERLEAERDRVEISPAQPEDAHRIDASDERDIAPGPAHVKHEDARRMQN